jgi:hypothetical protein
MTRLVSKVRTDPNFRSRLSSSVFPGQSIGGRPPEIGNFGSLIIAAFLSPRLLEGFAALSWVSMASMTWRSNHAMKPTADFVWVQVLS